uniref:LemA family protein n=1 Tax=Steinernema glaseri TaxID=37863 RepID=A0A1I7YKM0_9BILA
MEKVFVESGALAVFLVFVLFAFAVFVKWCATFYLRTRNDKKVSSAILEENGRLLKMRADILHSYEVDI